MSVLTKLTWYPDTDTDGLGAGEPLSACEQPSGYANNANDCDDSDASIRNGTQYFLDSDGDGYGDAASPKTACEQPSSHADNANDCDDTNDAINFAGYRSGTFGGESNITHLTPEYEHFDSETLAVTWDLHPTSTSPLIDAGDPSFLDYDGSRMGIGAYGGLLRDHME
jgi:hypothetical protein